MKLLKTFEYRDESVTFEVEINLDALCAEVCKRARRSRRGKGTMSYGDLKATVIERRARNEHIGA
jgi:hypothetical protein